MIHVFIVSYCLTEFRLFIRWLSNRCLARKQQCTCNCNYQGPQLSADRGILRQSAEFGFLKRNLAEEFCHGILCFSVEQIFFTENDLKVALL